MCGRHGRKKQATVADLKVCVLFPVVGKRNSMRLYPTHSSSIGTVTST